MNSASKIAYGFALVLGSASFVATAPALAKKKDQAAEAPAPKLTKAERAALMPLETAYEAKDWAAATAALPAARAASQSPDALYLVSSRTLSIGQGTNNIQMQAAGIDGMIASGKAPSTLLPILYKNQGILASNARDYAKAEAAYAKWAELAPNDPEAIILLADVKYNNRKAPEAVALIDRAIQAKKAAGQTVDESWYKRGLKIAFDGKMAPQTYKFSRELVTAYPSKQNWRDALLLYRDLGKLDTVMTIDVMRLMRAAKALNGERDFYELADALNDRGLPGESTSVIDEGIALKMVDGNKPTFKELAAVARKRVDADRAELAAQEKKASAAATGLAALGTADGYYGYGDYSKAVSLYRLALQKGSVDPNLVNTRLGMALAMSGQRAEAEAALRAVTGPRTELASFWLIWLSQRGA